MKKSKKISLKAVTFLAAICLCAGLNMSVAPTANVGQATICASAQTKSGENLADKKAQAKADVAAYFDGLEESAYGEAEWAALAKIESESGLLIDGAADVESVDEIVAGIIYAADGILTEEEKPAFEQYVLAAVDNVQAAFVESLYRDAERAEGAALVQESKAALEKATTYAEAEALELSYLAKIDALKTAAEWEAEESMKPVEPEFPTSDSVEEPEVENEGCSSSVEGITAIFSVTAMFALTVIANKKKEGI